MKRPGAPFKGLRVFLERMRGIEPPSQAWEAGILPMNYIRIFFAALKVYHRIFPLARPKFSAFPIRHGLFTNTPLFLSKESIKLFSVSVG